VANLDRQRRGMRGRGRARLDGNYYRRVFRSLTYRDVTNLRVTFWTCISGCLSQSFFSHFTIMGSSTSVKSFPRPRSSSFYFFPLSHRPRNRLLGDSGADINDCRCGWLHRPCGSQLAGSASSPLGDCDLQLADGPSGSRSPAISPRLLSVIAQWSISTGSVTPGDTQNRDCR